MNSSGMRSTSEPEGNINVLGHVALSMCLMLYETKYDNIYVKIPYMSGNLVPKSVRRELCRIRQLKNTFDLF